MKTNKKKALKIVLISVCALCLAAGIILSLIFFAPTYAVRKPKDSGTTEQPFIKGMSGSRKFRIPALVTMSDGTVVASCDARWNTFLDGGGLDTLVSVSSDNGENWEYTFANYLGDNGNRFDTRSSTFIDPAIISSSDGTLYLATTFYPAEVSLNSSPKKPLKEKAFDENGRLLLCEKNSGEYIYRLGEFDADGFADITNDEGEALPGYKIDNYFNITENGKKKGNLFFKNSPFSVVETTYIYLNVSYDKGKTWELPRLLNVKSDKEEFLGIAPGRGVELSDGTLVFSVYSLTDGDSLTQRSSFIYSSDSGESWHKAPYLSDEAGWSGESQLVTLSDNSLRCFFRNANSRICYADVTFKGDETVWSEPVITNFENCSACMISAINYSKPICDKRAILVSCPSSPGKREDGKIFVFTLDEKNEMDLYKTVDIKNGAFAYSCLTETADGKIAILYEIENNQIKFKNGIEIE